MTRAIKVVYATCCMLLAGVAWAQATAPGPSGYTVSKKDVADAVAKVKSGKFNGYHVGVIGEAGAVEAIPDLEVQFQGTSEPIDKAKIAQVLLALGDKKNIYWDFLVNFAKPALEGDAPNPIQYDERGKAAGMSPEFVGWAESHGISAADAGSDAVYLYPGVVMLLAMTHDARAIPLLRGALSSKNDMIAAAAARGLAEMGDGSSVPLIVDRCNKSPTEPAGVIAESLVYFDDPDAQKAVDSFVSPKKASLLRRDRKMGHSALHR